MNETEKKIQPAGNLGRIQNNSCERSPRCSRKIRMFVDPSNRIRDENILRSEINVLHFSLYDGDQYK